VFKVRFVLIGFMYVFLSVNSAFSQGWGVQEERPLIRFEYDNSSYSLSDYEIKVAILNVIIENRWQVVTQEKSKILAEYKERILSINIDGDKVIFEEVANGHAFPAKWMDSIEKYLEIEVERIYQINKAKAMHLDS